VAKLHLATKGSGVFIDILRPAFHNRRAHMLNGHAWKMFTFYP